MATRKKSEEEKDFNKLAIQYGRMPFIANDFDNDSNLKRALESFIKAKTFVLADDFSNLNDFTNEHHIFLENRHQFEHAKTVYEENLVVEYTQKLFRISSTPLAKKIACDYYREVFESSCNIFTNENGEDYQDLEINDKIDRFHIFFDNVNSAKRFIQTQFPRWQHADTKEKKKIRSDIEVLLNNLEILKIDIELRNVILYFVSKYKLNQDNIFKADILLSLNLPNINSHNLAKQIVKNLS